MQEYWRCWWGWFWYIVGLLGCGSWLLMTLQLGSLGLNRGLRNRKFILDHFLLCWICLGAAWSGFSRAGLLIAPPTRWIDPTSMILLAVLLFSLGVTRLRLGSEIMDEVKPKRKTGWVSCFGRTKFLLNAPTNARPFGFWPEFFRLTEFVAGKAGPIDDTILSGAGDKRISYRVFAIATSDVGRSNWTRLWESVYNPFVLKLKEIVELPEAEIPVELRQLLTDIDNPPGMSFQVQKLYYCPAVVYITGK